MKVVCINSFLLPKLNTGRHSHLTVGKVYDVLKISHYNEYGFMVDYVTNEINYVKFHKWNHDTIGYLVELNDMTYYFNTNRFEDVNVSRDNKLNELLK